ncbi:MAG: ribonuclease HIII [Vampirovibrionales bacterium]
MAHLKIKLAKPEQSQLYQQLQQFVEVWQLKLTPEQHCQYSLKGKLTTGETLQLKQYNNGTFYLDATTEAALQLLAGQLNLTKHLTSPPSSGSSPVLIPPIGATGAGMGLPTGGWFPCMGCDESGKGDYFGPLVSATVLLTQEQSNVLNALGVCDSKTLNEQRIQHLGKAIADTVGMEAIGVVELMPAQYNSLYTHYTHEKKNLNHLLAELHSKGVQGVLQRPSIQESLNTPSPQSAFIMVDQFGNERYLNTSFKPILQQGHTLHQQTKAEQFTAVAAASIIARYRFVLRMKQLSEQWKVSLPFGAGSTVPKMAKQLVRQHGRDVLEQLAKLHFKTTQQVLESF